MDTLDKINSLYFRMQKILYLYHANIQEDTVLCNLYRLETSDLIKIQNKIIINICNNNLLNINNMKNLEI